MSEHHVSFLAPYIEKAISLEIVVVEDGKHTRYYTTQEERENIAAILRADASKQS